MSDRLPDYGVRCLKCGGKMNMEHILLKGYWTPTGYRIQGGGRRYCTDRQFLDTYTRHRCSGRPQKLVT